MELAFDPRAWPAVCIIELGAVLYAILHLALHAYERFIRWKALRAARALLEEPLKELLTRYSQIRVKLNATAASLESLKAEETEILATSTHVRMLYWEAIEKIIDTHEELDVLEDQAKEMKRSLSIRGVAPLFNTDDGAAQRVMRSMQEVGDLIERFGEALKAVMPHEYCEECHGRVYK